MQHVNLMTSTILQNVNLLTWHCLQISYTFQFNSHYDTAQYQCNVSNDQALPAK